MSKREHGVSKKSRGTRPQKHEGQLYDAKYLWRRGRRSQAMQDLGGHIKDLGLYLESNGRSQCFWQRTT